MFRKTLFWAHLISGLLAGLVIFMMSLTGVLITYERQIENWFARADYLSADQHQAMAASIDNLIEISKYRNSEFYPDTVIVINHPGAPISLRQGRNNSIQLNPYTGEEMQIGSPALENFFSAVTGWHRWFNMSGEDRATARSITGVSNLVFLFLILSGTMFLGSGVRYPWQSSSLQLACLITHGQIIWCIRYMGKKRHKEGRLQSIKQTVPATQYYPCQII
jgi:uncharacterized iron-regulated membrane protein